MNLHFAGTTRSTHGDAMRLWDAAGYLASGLVVLAFCMKDIIPLRVVALTSNIAFLAYGIGLGLVPVWLLHAILLPINCWRLLQGISRRHAVVPARGNGQQAQQRSGLGCNPSRREDTFVAAPKRPSSSFQSDVLPTMVGPSKSRPPMSHRKTDS